MSSNPYNSSHNLYNISNNNKKSPITKSSCNSTISKDDNNYFSD